jgi:hypothetical protein
MDPAYVTQWHQEDILPFESDDFGFDGAAGRARIDITHVANRGRRAPTLNDQSNHLFYEALGLNGLDVL